MKHCRSSPLAIATPSLVHTYHLLMHTCADTHVCNTHTYSLVPPSRKCHVNQGWFLITTLRELNQSRTIRTGLPGSPMCRLRLCVPGQPGAGHSPYRIQLHHGLQLLDGHLWFHAHYNLPCGARRGGPIAQHVAAPEKPDWTDRRQTEEEQSHREKQ